MHKEGYNKANSLYYDIFIEFPYKQSCTVVDKGRAQHYKYIQRLSPGVEDYAAKEYNEIFKSFRYCVIDKHYADKEKKDEHKA